MDKLGILMWIRCWAREPKRDFCLAGQHGMGGQGVEL